jgi:hypothetical protein
MRLTQLTRTEILSLPPNTAVYEGVGKMYVIGAFGRHEKAQYVLGIDDHCRFVALPILELKDKLGSQIKDIETDVEGLGKRLHYLETTAKNSQGHIEQMLGRAGST